MLKELQQSSDTHHYKRLESIDISGVWGEISFNTKISNINLFIGYNGTGKTTFVKIIESVLTFDANILNEVDFKKCSLFFSNNSKIICEKNVAKDPDMIYYLIKDDDKTIFDSKLDLSEHIHRRRGNRFYLQRSLYNSEEIFNIRLCLSKIANVSWLSLERSDIHNYIKDDDSFIAYGGVDKKLQEVSNRLKEYQAELERAEKQELEHFREEVFKLMLFDEKIDEIDALFSSFSGAKSLQTKDEKNQLENIFRELGAFNEDIVNQMSTHFKRMTSANENIVAAIEKKTNLDVNDVIVLTLYKRTEKMIELSKELKIKKEKIYELKNLFEKLLSSFCNNKTFSLFDSFHFYTSNGISANNKAISVNRCSSGEKQLLILFSEVLLQDKNNSIFIADEPELSLHIDWQRQIVEAITKLNPNVQLIFATHAPEIVAKWSSKVINMSSITYKDKS
jgi:energy-coupling factor transporter ATP-binding protein EcfA2